MSVGGIIHWWRACAAQTHVAAWKSCFALRERDLNPQWHIVFFFLSLLCIAVFAIYVEMLRKVWLHQSHADKWNLFCPLLLIRDNKNKKTLVVVIQDVSSCRNIQFWAGRNCRMCSMWLNVGNCTETNCTWRFKADSFCNKHHLGCSANDLTLLTTSHWALICVRASVHPWATPGAWKVQDSDGGVRPCCRRWSDWPHEYFKRRDCKTLRTLSSWLDCCVKALIVVAKDR